MDKFSQDTYTTFLFNKPFLCLRLHISFLLMATFQISLYHSFDWKSYFTWYFLAAVNKFDKNSFVVHFHFPSSNINKTAILRRWSLYNLNILFISLKRNCQNFDIFSHSHHTWEYVLTFWQPLYDILEKLYLFDLIWFNWH